MHAYDIETNVNVGMIENYRYRLSRRAAKLKCGKKENGEELAARQGPNTCLTSETRFELGTSDSAVQRKILSTNSFNDDLSWSVNNYYYFTMKTIDMFKSSHSINGLKKYVNKHKMSIGMFSVLHCSHMTDEQSGIRESGTTNACRALYIISASRHI